MLAPTVSQRLSTDFSLPARVASYASSGDRRLVSADGRTTYGLVFPSDDGAADRGDPAVATAAALRTALPAGTALEVTGIDQLSAHDDGGSAGAEVVNLTLIGGLGALAVLLLVFGSVLALAPLLVAAVAILATLLLVGLLTVLTEVNLIVEYLVALIGLGVAIDYSLLLVTRWREERTAGHAGDQAVHRAMASAGRSVVLSASTVAVGLLSLVVLPVPYLRSVGVAGLLIRCSARWSPSRCCRWRWPARAAGSTGRGGGSGRMHVGASRAWTTWARAVVRGRWGSDGGGSGGAGDPRRVRAAPAGRRRAGQLPGQRRSGSPGAGGPTRRGGAGRGAHADRGAGPRQRRDRPCGAGEPPGAGARRVGGGRAQRARLAAGPAPPWSRWRQWPSPRPADRPTGPCHHAALGTGRAGRGRRR